MALSSTRPVLLFATALGVAAPAVWWALDLELPSVQAARRPAELVDAQVGAGGDASAVESGATAAALPSIVAADPRPAAADWAGAPPTTGGRTELVRPERSAPSEANAHLGVLLHGDLLTDVPGLTGSVAILALGPDGAAVDSSATIGGSYSLLGLTPGDWELVLRGRAILEHRSFITVEQGQVTLDRDLVVQPAPVVDVRFYTSWGERLESALAEPGRDPAGFPQLELVVSDDRRGPSDSRFRRSRVADETDAPLPEVSGWLDLRTAPPVEVRLVQAGRELERRTIEDPSQPLEFTVDPLEVSGRPSLTANFVDATDGRAIEHAVVELYRPGVAAPVRSRALRPGGVLHLAGIGAGEWVMSVLSAGRAPLLHDFTIEAEVDYDLGAIELEPAVALTGRLLGPDGRPLGNRRVRWTRSEPTPSWVGRAGFDGARTDSGGTFAIANVPSGRILLVAGGEQFAARKFEVSVEQLDRGLEVQLREGTAVDFVLGGLGDDEAESFTLEVRDADGHLMARRRGAAGRVTRIVLESGRYVARAMDAGRALAEEPFSVADRPVEVAIGRD